MNIKDYIKKYWLLFIIITQPILDIIAFFSFDEFLTPISFVVRSLYLIFIVIYTFINYNNKKKYILSLLPICLFSLIHLFNTIRLSGLNIFDDLRYLILVMQFPILTISLSLYLSKHKKEEEYIEKGFSISLVLIFISVALSILTNSYETTYENYGITGWFTSSNTQSMILSMIIPFSLYYFSKKNNKTYLMALIVTFFLLFFNATRACYYTLLATGLVMSWITITEKNKNKAKIISTLIFFILSISMYNFSFTELKTDESQDNANENLEIVEDYDNLSKEEAIKALNSNYLYEEMIENFGEDRVYEEMKDKITAYNLTDNRLLKKTYAKFIFEDSDTLTKLVGFNHYEIEKYGKDLENDFTAIFYYYGYIGFILYLVFILYFIYLGVKLFINNPKIIFNGKFIILSFSIALTLYGSEFSGACLRKSNANIYIALILVMYYIFYKEQTRQKELKDNNITILALHLGFGGVEQYISSLCKMLENKYNINIISTYKVLEKPAFPFSKNINITYLIDDKPNREEFKEAIKQKNIIKILKEGLKSIKLLYLKKYKNINAIKNIDSRYIITTREFHNKLTGKYADKNIIKIATEHNYHNNDTKYINTVLKSIKNFNYFILVSEELKDFYQGKTKDTKCIFIPNVIDNLPEKYTTLKENNIINIGRLEKEKGQLDLIEIVKEVKKEIKDLKLYLIGDGSLKKEIENKIKEYNLEDTIILTGFIDKKEIEKYLLKSKLFVMTSYTESFGLVLIEAMSYKVPCIAYDSASGARELLKKDNGVLIKNRDKDMMVKEIIKLLKDNSALKKISEKGHESCKKYLIDNVQKEWIELLNGVNYEKEKKGK